MSEYPALLELSTRTLYPLGQAPKFVVGRNQKADLPVVDIQCSRTHFQLVRDAGHFSVETLSTTSPTYCNNLPVVGRVALMHGSILRAGACTFRFLLWPEATEEIYRSEAAGGIAVQPTQPPIPAFSPPPPPTGPTATIMAPMPGFYRDLAGIAGTAGIADHPDQAELPPPEQLKGVIRVDGQMLIGREVDRVQIHLPHVHVSRIHAQIVQKPHHRATVTDLNSANGTFVNGNRILRPTDIRDGDRIDIGPYSLVFDGLSLWPQSREDNVELICRNLVRTVSDRATGKPIRLLDDITLVIRPKEFVCLLGPSGSGKSTLLSALSARVPADEGAVLLNQKDLYSNFEALKQDLAVVPQKDILHDSLSVETALWYTAKLRLPPDTSGEEIQDCIDQMLRTVRLTKQAGVQIRHLSGGQVKRASLANEILCKPTLLFLDEVTSGLDEQTDREMMALFREVADSGKTVVCITHSLANVERNCHLVVILTPGGKLAFIGSPDEALGYFGIQRLGDVYDLLTQKPAEEWQAEFLRSQFYRTYVTDRLPQDEDDGPQRVIAQRRTLRDRVGEFTRQTWLLSRRYLAIQLGDVTTLLTMVGQSLLVAMLLVLVFGYLPGETDFVRPRLLKSLYFLLSTACFWFGCNNASKEIVKEREIYTRERDFNLNVTSYYASKFFLLVLFTAVQATVLHQTVYWLCQPPDPFLNTLPYLQVIGLAGVAMGLAISAFARNTDMATTLTPLIVIPQIILSDGVIVNRFNDLARWVAMSVATNYWGFHSLMGQLSRKDAGTAEFDRLQMSPWIAISMVLVHTVVLMAVAVLILTIQDRRRKRFGLQVLVNRVLSGLKSKPDAELIPRQ